LFLVLVAPAAAEVLVFDRYDTVSRVSGDSITIEREMTLTNVARNPVIPGELHFRLYQQEGADRKPIAVSDFTATNERGQKLSTKITTRASETDLAVTIWDPMLPGFSYTFRTSYVMRFEPSGLLFYELQIPQEDTTIPIKNAEQTVILEGNYHVTYAPDTAVTKMSGNAVVSWAGQNEGQVIEYSSLPLPRIRLGSLTLRAVNVFWGVVIIALLGLFAFSVKRDRDRRRDEEELARLEAEHHRVANPSHPGSSHENVSHEKTSHESSTHTQSSSERGPGGV
jgi:hypothetical protein